MRVDDEIESQLRALVAKRLGAEAADIRAETSLSEDLGADSLDMVSLIMDIEDAFDIDVPDEDAARIVTVEQLTEYVALAVANDAARSLQVAMAHSTAQGHG